MKVKWAIYCPESKHHWKFFYEESPVDAWHRAKKLCGDLKFKVFPVR